MRTLAFLDCPTGISGDMCLGALVSAGVPLSYLQSQLGQLQLPEQVELREHTVRRNGIAATQVEVGLPYETEPEAVHPPTRHLHDVEALIQSAALPQRAIAWSLAIFRRLAAAEGAVHGIDPAKVHFHEVGATDAIADIVGTCLGLDWLGIDEVYCAPLPTGRGTVRAAHGRLPLPAPAVLKLMEMAEVPLYNSGLQGELVTPTGAAIATELAGHFGDPPPMKLRKVGLGAGNRNLAIPNILRLWIGSATQESTSRQVHDAARAMAHHNHPSVAASPNVSLPTVAPESVPPLPPATVAPERSQLRSDPLPPPDERVLEQRQGVETIVVLETQVDDLSPQAIGYLYDRLLTAGALDIFTCGVTMKKCRPGHVITVIAYPDRADCCERLLLQETTTLGVRRTEQTRLRLGRKIVRLQTPLGPVRMKLAFEPGHSTPLKAHPEYEDCAAIARQHGRSWREIHNQALHHWYTHMQAASSQAEIVADPLDRFAVEEPSHLSPNEANSGFESVTSE